MKKYDIFLFDADNTLFNYDMAEENALKIMFKYCCFNYTDNIHFKYRKINSQVWESFENKEITKDELQTIRFKRLFDEINVNYDPIIFNQKYLYELGKGSFLINGALEICKNIISNYKKIYIVTNGILSTQKSKIEHSLIKEYISDYFVSELVGYNKPNKLYFDYVFSHIPKVDKEKIIIIGDSILHDIVGGINAGIDNCWFNENGKINETEFKPTYEITKLQEINKFI